MRYVLNIDDRSVDVVFTTLVTREQASAIIAMAPGDAVELDDGSAHYLGDTHDRDPLIEFVSSGVRPSARRSLLLPQLRAIQRGHGIAVD